MERSYENISRARLSSRFKDWIGTPEIVCLSNGSVSVTGGRHKAHTKSCSKMYDHPTTYSRAYTREGQDGMVHELQQLEGSSNPAIHQDQKVPV